MKAFKRSMRLILAAAPLIFSSLVHAQQPPDPVDSDNFNDTAIGRNALYYLETGGGGGAQNSAFGAHALFLNTTGTANSAFGANALTNNSIGNSNTASGSFALYNNTTGSNNTATGNGAL